MVCSAGTETTGRGSFVGSRCPESTDGARAPQQWSCQRAIYRVGVGQMGSGPPTRRVQDNSVQVRYDLGANGPARRRSARSARCSTPSPSVMRCSPPVITTQVPILAAGSSLAEPQHVSERRIRSVSRIRLGRHPTTVCSGRPTSEVRRLPRRRQARIACPVQTEFYIELH